MKEYNKKLTKEMHQKWIDGTKIAQLEKEYDLSKDAIYKRLNRLQKENTQNITVSNVRASEIPEMDYDSGDVTNETHSSTYDGTCEEIIAEQEFQNNNDCTVPSNNHANTVNKTGFVSGRTIGYIGIAIVLSLAVVFWWPQISSTLKSTYAKIHDKIAGRKDCDSCVLPPADVSLNSQY